MVKDGEDWHRLQIMMNLEKFGLNFSRCTKPDVTPFKAILAKALSWQRWCVSAKK